MLGHTIVVLPCYVLTRRHPVVRHKLFILLIYLPVRSVARIHAGNEAASTFGEGITVEGVQDRTYTAGFRRRVRLEGGRVRR